MKKTCSCLTYEQFFLYFWMIAWLQYCASMLCRIHHRSFSFCVRPLPLKWVRHEISTTATSLHDELCRTLLHASPYRCQQRKLQLKDDRDYFLRYLYSINISIFFSESFVSFYWYNWTARLKLDIRLRFSESNVHITLYYIYIYLLLSNSSPHTV
jgi:hypothetical protein